MSQSCQVSSGSRTATADASANMSGLRTSSMTLQRLQPDSPPSAVRAYLIAILRERHGVPESEAMRIATGWSHGRGAELMSSDIEMFRGLFGSEFGAILSTYMREDLSQDEVIARGAASQPRRTVFGADPDCESNQNHMRQNTADFLSQSCWSNRFF